MVNRGNALIVGSAGQDGTLLTDILRQNGQRVLGVSRSSVTMPDGEILTGISILDSSAVNELVRAFGPDELYYLAAYHHSSQDAINVDERELLKRSRAVHVTGFTNFLDALCGLPNHASVFYAASSHVFGWPVTQPQSETTPFDPQCAYGISKVEGIECARRYRKERGLAVSCGILFNHESVLRRPGFVSRKIAEGAVNIQGAARNGTIELGDLDARIDWGYAADTCQAMRLILRLGAGDDYIVGTGETHSIAEFAETAFKAVGIENWRDHILVNPGLVGKRPRLLCGDSSKLRAATSWAPTFDFHGMVRRLVADYAALSDVAQA